MPRQHRRTFAAAVFGATGCLLLSACGGSTPVVRADSPAPIATPAVKSNTPAVQTTPSTGIRPTESASTAAVTKAAPVGAPQACAIFTHQEVRTALGTDPGPGSPFTSHGSSQCQYGSFQTAFVLVNLTPSRGEAGYNLMRNNPKLSHGVTVAETAGVGDKAFEVSGPHTASVYFVKGDALVLVMVEIQAASSPPMSQALALARTAAERI